MVSIHTRERLLMGRGGLCDEVEYNNDIEYVQIINIYRYRIYINMPENDVVDHNYKDILK